MIYLLTLILAAASIIYELVLAQSLAATLGGTLVRYNVTIGLYLASMGVGALLAGRGTHDTATRLIRIEVLLAAIGGVAPALVLYFDHTFGERWAVELFAHGLIVLIGALSGVELPLLMTMGESERPGGSTRVLATDYFGTLLGAVSFPLLLLPTLGIFGVAAVSALINAVAAALLAVARRRSLWKEIVLLTLLAGVFAGALSRIDLLQDLLVERFYLSR